MPFRPGYGSRRGAEWGDICPSSITSRRLRQDRPAQLTTVSHGAGASTGQARVCLGRPYRTVGARRHHIKSQRPARDGDI
jgi:hypothetical protein